MKPSLIPPEEASHFYHHWLNADPEKNSKKLQAVTGGPLTELDLASLLKNETDAGFPLPRAMRRLRNLIICAIICRDITGKADLAEVLETMTLFAEFAIRTHVKAIYDEMTDVHGIPTGAHSGKKQEMIVLGMGKLGGRELNVSSDIDLIFVYPENGETVSTRAGQRILSNQEFFIRLGKRFMGALSEIAEDGFTFRVDMALRPNGSSGPLAGSFSMVEQYFVVQGREWERYAWIKARAITGCPEDIDALSKISRPFVYRRYLDFNVIDSIRGLHQQIRADAVRRARQHPGRNSYDVKLGRGGIREIEFLAQIFQLIRGGREPALQDRSTRRILHILAEKNLLDKKMADALLNSYTFLRNLEHRCQYLNDAQTHSLPPDQESLLLVAKASGFETVPELLAELKRHQDFVAEQFDAIFKDKSAPSDSKSQDLAHPPMANQSDEEKLQYIQSRFEGIGIENASGAARRMLEFWKSARIKALADASRNKMITLLSILMPQLKNVEKPLVTLGRTLDFLESIARRTAYVSLLTEFPDAAKALLQMFDASDWASRYLTRHPILLDELLDARTLMAPPDWDAFSANLDAQLEARRGDTELLMDTLRENHHAQLFRILAQDLAGGLTVEKQADHLSKLADIMVEATLREVWLAMPRRHCDVPHFAVIAYGKLGGKELGYASDLDVVFLYDDDHPDAPTNYARLAQRFITWMTTPTSAGFLFDVDIALRPDGASGLMASSCESFKRYQEKSAWAWEHQALTRARFCAGDKAIGEWFEELRNRILMQSRDPAWLKEEIIKMRQRISDAHPNRSDLFDVKHDTGGMMDIEFIVQYLVLAHAKEYPELTQNFGNIALLKMSEKLGLVPEALGESVSAIYRDFRRLQHQLRMQGSQEAKTSPDSVEAQVGDVKKLWDYVFKN